MPWNKLKYSGWGNAISVEAEVARPERHAALADLISGSERILPIGNQRSYGDAPLAVGGRGLKTVRLDRFIDFDEDKGLLEVEAGVRLGEIVRIFAPRGWMPAVVPGTGMTTVGGAIANDVHGKNHHVDGSFGQHVESFILMSANGEARQVNASKDPDLFKATVGGVGQTGLITSAVLRLARCPSTKVTVAERRIRNLNDFFAAFDASSSQFQVGWIDALAGGDNLGRGILEEADFSHQGLTPFKPAKKRSLPLTPAAIFVSGPIVKLFNAIYYRRTPSGGRVVDRELHEFFFPLDKIADWNRLYGKEGFYQFQSVIPTDHAKVGITELLKTISEGGIASPLAVVKKMGSGRAGYLSFPMEGFTLAVDLPNRPKTQELLDKLSDITQAHGGRIYLAKDGAASASKVASMYPELVEFRKTVGKIDPEQKFLSTMAERLSLRGAS